MYIRRRQAGVVQRARSNEGNFRAYARVIVVAPENGSAPRTAVDGLSLAAGAGASGSLYRARVDFQPVPLNQGVNCKRRTGFALAPAAVAAVHYHWWRQHPIADVATGAVASGKSTYPIHLDFCLHNQVKAGTGRHSHAGESGFVEYLREPLRTRLGAECQSYVLGAGAGGAYRC